LTPRRRSCIHCRSRGLAGAGSGSSRSLRRSVRKHADSGKRGAGEKPEARGSLAADSASEGADPG